MLLRRCLPWLLIGVMVLASSGGALAQSNGPNTPAFLVGPGFTYQGELHNGSGLVNDSCNFKFSVYDLATVGNQIGATEAIPGVSVVNGRFTVLVNAGGQFGASAFDGSARWLEIAVMCSTDVSYTTLSPRQPLTAAPLAMALPGLRTQPNATSPDVIGGSISNTVGTAVGATVVGGGDTAGDSNGAVADYATVGGGFANTAGGIGATVSGGGWDGTLVGGNTAVGIASTIGGGWGNTIPAPAKFAVVGGGGLNTASGFWATIAGGDHNTASGQQASVGGGLQNVANNQAASVGGGDNNTASGQYATVSGGQLNIASGDKATVVGGQQNTASGSYATVAGGTFNTAQGFYSFAAGDQAQALHQGDFVWSDTSASPFASTANNQFLVRATGGISLTTNNAGTVGCNLSAGGGTWNCTSDRNAKTNFAAVDGLQVLDALAGIPIQTWNFKTQPAAIRHMGPMAQDFNAAFGVGENDTTISTVDAQGVALAAIQGLYALVQQKDAQLAAQDARLTAQDTRLATLETAQSAMQARLAALEAQGLPAAQAAPAQLPLALPWLLLAGLVLLNVGAAAGYLAARAKRG